MSEEISRRKFLKDGLLAVAGVVALGSGASEKPAVTAKSSGGKGRVISDLEKQPVAPKEKVMPVQRKETKEKEEGLEGKQKAGSMLVEAKQLLHSTDVELLRSLTPEEYNEPREIYNFWEAEIDRIRQTVEEKFLKGRFNNSEAVEKKAFRNFRKYQNKILKALAQSSTRHNIPVWNVIGIMGVESYADPEIKDSSAGAVGLMQIKPSTVKERGVDRKLKGSSYIEISNNIEAGVRYLRFLYDRYFAGQWGLTAAGYNAGHRGVQKILQANCPGVDYHRQEEKFLANPFLLRARGVKYRCLSYAIQVDVAAGLMMDKYVDKEKLARYLKE